MQRDVGGGVRVTFSSPVGFRSFGLNFFFGGRASSAPCVCSTPGPCVYSTTGETPTTHSTPPCSSLPRALCLANRNSSEIAAAS